MPCKIIVSCGDNTNIHAVIFPGQPWHEVNVNENIGKKREVGISITEAVVSEV